LPHRILSNYKKFTKDVGLAGIAQTIAMLKGLIPLPILTKTLGAEMYGIWALIMVTISLLMPLALLQLYHAMTRFLTAEKNKEKINKGFSSIFAASASTAFILSFLIFILAEPLAVAVFGGADATYFVRQARCVSGSLNHAGSGNHRILHGVSADGAIRCFLYTADDW